MSVRSLAFLASIFGLALPAFAEAPADFFERKIRPVLIAECYKCHSAQAEKLKGGLRLDSPDGILKGGDSGHPAVSPGNADKSPLIEAIRYANPDLQMPPKKQLPREVVDDFVAWVEMGAPDPRTADSIATSKPDPKSHWAFQPVRNVTPPAVKDHAWIASPVDAFILAKLEQSALHPAPRADNRTLIRRAYFDLLGLPPTFEEVQAFERDTSPNAYETLLDRLLASPRYGERWGRYWLDLARYADTKGYVYSDREEPRFVHSHNYRDWVIRAVNDDMPYDRFIKLQIAADQMDARREDLAAMGFLTVGRRFLGIIHDIVDDRIDVVTRTTQGLSVGCARCHDHKFDPIPTQDYYSLYGVFAASTERLVPLAADPEHKTPEWESYQAGLKKRTDALASLLAKKSEEVADRARARTPEYLRAVLEAEKQPDELFYINRDGNDIYPLIVRQWQQYLFARARQHSPIWQPWFNANTAASHAGAHIARGSPGDTIINPHVRDALSSAHPTSMRDLADAYGKLFLEADRKWKEALKTNPKASVLDDPAWEEIRQVLYAPDSPVRVPAGSVVDLEFYFDEGTRVQLSKAQMEIDKWQIDAPGATPQALILQDRPTPGNPRVFRRGNPATPGEEVPRRYLEIIAGPDRKPFKSGSGRLELADAIANKDNPLTARVMVNRIWHGHFGAGLVKTPSDFGLRCEPPSHPDLLDCLATRFMQDGWSIKKLHRLIMLSSVYRQGGDEQPNASAADPENRLLWHFLSQRLDFEALHDSLLAASGELDLNVGGRPVEMFNPPASKRRAVYGRIDRQFLPGIFRVFDFANPDLHSPQRGNTTVPQQALFMMNSRFVIERVRALANRKDLISLTEPAARVERLYQVVYQRPPTDQEVAAGVAFVASASAEPPEKPKPVPTAWQYGIGEFDAATGKIKGFAKLPHYTGGAWQGGASWPDPVLGWAQLTADGGHAGNDPQHAVVRRWVAPIDGPVSITGAITHAHPEGHGIIARILSSRQGELASWRLHNQKAPAAIDPVQVQKGETIDFVVSIKESLNNNDFLWAPIIKSADAKTEWNAKKEFNGAGAASENPLTAWEKYVQVLLMSDELVFVD
jgi:hypothetical protein